MITASGWRALKISMWSSSSLRHVPTNLSAIEFARGARYGSRKTFTLSSELQNALLQLGVAGPAWAWRALSDRGPL